MSTIPTENVTTQLITSMITAIDAIDTIDMANIRVGFDENIDNDNDSAFPKVLIIPDKNEGDNYHSQRDIVFNVGFLIFVHLRTTTESRADGDDMKSVSLYGSAIMRALYGFNSDTALGSPPCTNFVQTNPRFTITPAYEEFSENVNTAIIEMSFQVYSADTNL